MSPVNDQGASPPAERMSPWAPLRHTVFAALFAAQLGSNIGSFFQTVAAAWLMGDLTSSATLVALIQTASLLPFLLLGLPAGALADIFDRRLLLIGTQAWMLLCALLLAVLTMTDHVTPGTLLALTFALGIGTALMGPAWQAIQPDLVPQREFGQAVALSSLTFNAGRAIGPALGGALVASAGAGWAFIVNAASFLGVVVVLVWWRPQRTSVRLSTESLPGAVKAGLRYGANAPALRGILVRTLAFAVPAAAIQALLPAVVRDRLGLGSGGFGILLGCFGIGAALAAVVRPRIDNLLTSDQSVTASALDDRRRPRARRHHLVGVGGRAGAVPGRRGMDHRHGDAQRRDPVGPAVVGARPRTRAVPRRAGRRDRRRQRGVGRRRRLEPADGPRHRGGGARRRHHDRAGAGASAPSRTSICARRRRRHPSSCSNRTPTPGRCW